MSEFLAEAKVLVRPDTTAFRAELMAQLAAATRGAAVTIPVVAGVAGIPGQMNLLAAETALATGAARSLSSAQIDGAKANKLAAASAAEHSRQLKGLRQGALSSGLSLFGIRGATLAASSAFLAGAAAVVTFSKAVGVAASLERDLNVFRVTADATAEEMERVAAAARELGRDISLPGVSAGDAARAMTELAKAGLSIKDAMEGARGTLLLATAAELETATATEIVANALNSFGLAGERAIDVADLLAAASIEAQGSIADMGGALTQAASVSRQVGISLEDTVALLSILAKNGIQGAAGGTVLRVALLRLVNPAAAAREQLEKLGVAIRDSQGRIRPEVFSDLERATRKLTAANRDAALAQIFGTRGIRAQVNIAREGVDGLNRMRESTQQGGDAAEIAGAQTEGFSGKVENLSNQVEGLGLLLGGVLIPTLGALVDVLAAGAGGVNSFIEALRRTREGIKDADTDTVPFADHLNSAAESVSRFTRNLFDSIPGITAMREGIRGLGGENLKAMTQFEAFNKVLEDQLNIFSALGSNINEAAEEIAKGVNLKPIAGRLAGLDEQITQADIGGDIQQRLAARRRELAQIERDLGRPAIQRRPELRRKLLADKLSLIREIAAIENEAASEADRISREIDTARAKADQAFQRLLEEARRPVENLIDRATGTETLRDDIKFGERLRDVLNQQIKQAQKTIKDVTTRQDTVAALRQRLIDVINALKKDRADFREEIRRALEEQQERLQLSIRLDIELAEITENRRAEVRARERLIRELEKEIRGTKKGTNKWKELRNEIARERAELRRLKNETKERGNAFRQLTFEFLQTQQGFAANLLGNLLPSGAAAGTVGGASGSRISLGGPGAGLGVGQRTTQEAGLQEARDRLGLTAGQGSTLVAEVRAMRKAIERLAGTQDHPEARRQRQINRASMDTVGGV